MTASTPRPKEAQPQQPDPTRASAQTWIRERLADIAHLVWGKWMIYLFTRAVKNADGSVTIPAGFVARWERQINTDYWALSEEEKESDREVADFYLRVLEEFFRK